MSLQWLGYTDKESRNEKAQSLKDEGKRHVVKYSTHEGNSRTITWVVCWDEPQLTVAQEESHEDSADRSTVS
jgi:hypothetical protein